MKHLHSLSLRLINHQWKESTRSSYWQKSLLVNILLGILLVYLLLNLLFLGFFLGKIMLSAFPDRDPTSALSGILFYYFVGDFLLRFLMQPAPVISIMPLMHLPVRRSSLFHYLLMRSALSLFNFLPLAVFIPFFIRYVIPDYSMLAATVWFLTIILLIFTNNYLVFFFRKLFSVKPAIIVGILAAAIGLIWGDIALDFTISRTIGNGLMGIVSNPGLLSIPFIALLLTYILSWFYLYRQRYMEVGKGQEKLYSVTGQSRYITKKFGVTGSLVNLEMKMILRNNRPRNYLVISALFLFYGFLVYGRSSSFHAYGMMLFIGILITGIMMMQYGQLLFSWESSYFDRLCTVNITIRDMVLAKFSLLLMFNTIAFLVTLPYAFFDISILGINFAAFLFNCGINSLIVIFLATYNTKSLDLGKGAFFNYEGVSAANFILIFPVIGFPVLIFWVFSMISNPAIGILMTALAGIAGLVFHRYFLGLIANHFISRRHNILNGFRNA